MRLEDYEMPFQSEVEVTWEFPKFRVPYFGVLIIRILLFKVLS